MAVVPRTLEDILQSMRQTHAEIDPVADITKGPIAVLLYCYASELSRVEQQTGYLSSIYQLETADTLPQDDLENLGRNYGKDPNVGYPAQVILTCWMRSRPRAGKQYTLPEGTQASTDDGRFIYSFTRSATINGDSPDLYYNSSEQWYEVNVLAEAVAVGTDYNLPPNAINRFVGTISDFDGVVNKKAATNGQDPLNAVQFRNIIWDSMQGLNSGVAGSILNSILNLNPVGFDDASLVPSSDYVSFYRLPYLNGKLGYDVYLITDLYSDDVQSGVALGGETEIILNKCPVIGAVYVTVDGISVPFTFTQDNSKAFMGSPYAVDKVVLTTAMIPNQVYEVRYYYYNIIYEAQKTFKFRNRPFGTDLLVRRANPVPIFIGGILVTSSVLDRESIISSMRQFTEAYLRNPDSPSTQRRTFATYFDPYTYQETIRRAITGIASFNLTNFVRMDSAVMDIETIVLDGKTEYPILSPNFYIT